VHASLAKDGVSNFSHNKIRTGTPTRSPLGGPEPETESEPSRILRNETAPGYAAERNDCDVDAVPDAGLYVLVPRTGESAARFQRRTCLRFGADHDGHHHAAPFAISPSAPQLSHV
jgi:hypothetical protein